MYKVIIVDDEKQIVQGIKVFIDWEHLGYEVVGEAYNGQAGYELALELNPNVIITDIRMPILDGLNMIDKIKQTHSDCRFIILSGYSDFEYARDAVEKGACSYLLKPVKETELISRLTAIKKEIEQEDYKKKENENLKKQLRESLPLLRESYLNEIVSNEFMAKEEIYKRWSFLNITYSLEKLCVLIIEIDDLYEKYGSSIEDMLLIKFAVNNIVEELLDNIHGGIVFGNTNERLVVLCCGQRDYDISDQSVQEFADRVRRFIEKYLKETVTIAAGGLYSDAACISTSFREAQTALKYKLVYGRNSFISIHDINILTEDFIIPVKLEKELLMHVEIGQKNEALNSLEAIFSYLKSVPSCKPEYLQNICVNILVQVSRFVVLNCESSLSSIENEKFSPKLLFEIKTLEGLKKHMHYIVSDAVDFISSNRNNKMKGTMGAIKGYIENNYSNEITLDFLSGKFYINSCYLSQLFKKELGYTFIEFLTRVRIENAKKLLLDPKYKVSEVASMVGYQNQRYFSHIFEKNVGCTPRDFRKEDMVI